MILRDSPLVWQTRWRSRSHGKTTKSVRAPPGPIQVTVRDGNSSFEPVIVLKGDRRLAKLEDTILSLYARGLSTRDIAHHLSDIYGTKASAATISRITDLSAD